MEHNFSHVDVNEMEELHGELFKYSDHKVGQRIRYRLGKNTHSGEILWACAQGELLDQHVPMCYVVMRDMADNVISFPDVVYRTGLLSSTDEQPYEPHYSLTENNRDGTYIKRRLKASSAGRDLTPRT